MLIGLSDAAAVLGLSCRTLQRLEMCGVIDFQRVGRRVYVDLTELMEAKVLTLGRAARLVNRCWRTAQRWADEGRLSVHHLDYDDSRGRCSIHEIYFAKNQKDFRRSGGRE